jgi:hypothetical protein
MGALVPSEFFPQLAAHLPHLEALHIVALVQQYNLVCHHYPRVRNGIIYGENNNNNEQE